VQDLVDEEETDKTQQFLVIIPEPGQTSFRAP
jgi:hypothetical protein